MKSVSGFFVKRPKSALVVALVPLLGIGGFRLLSAESTGPEKGRLTSRIADTAKVLWLLYVALTALQAVLLRCCGMGWVDAVCHRYIVHHAV